MDVGVIGTGVMGRNHVRVYSEMKEVSSLFIYDVNEKAARECAGQTGAIACSTIEELLRNVDAASVCVPTKYHYGVALQILKAGIHTLVEKPLCATAATAEELVRAIPSGTILGTGHIERFNPIVSEIQRILRKPLFIELKRHNPSSSRITDSTVIEDLMIHDIDILCHVLMRGSYEIEAGGTAEVMSTLFRFGPTPAILSASRKSSKKVRSIYIEEEEFTIEGDFMAQEIYVYRKPEHYRIEQERYVQENIIEKVLVNKLEPLKVELRTFLECARTGRNFPVTPLEAVENLQICEAIRARCSDLL
jgi:predicted dehydrogenase